MPDVIIIIVLSTIILKFKKSLLKKDYKICINLSPKINLKYTAIPFQRNSEVTRVRFHIKDNAILHTT